MEVLILMERWEIQYQQPLKSSTPKNQSHAYTCGNCERDGSEHNRYELLHKPGARIKDPRGLFICV